MAEAIEMNNVVTLAEAIAFLEEFRNVNIPLRLNLIRQLSAIALALGEERTRTDLLPALAVRITGIHPEVGLALAEQLGIFTNLVGGPEHSICLIPPLESLATVEETVVREKAVESLRIILEGLVPFFGPRDLAIHVIPTLERLRSHPTSFGRASACGLFSVLYMLVPHSRKAEVLNWFCQLCQDEALMVRRAAVNNLFELSMLLPKPNFDKVRELFILLAADSDLQIREEAVNARERFKSVGREPRLICGIEISPTMLVGIITMSVVLIVLFFAFVIYPAFIR